MAVSFVKWGATGANDGSSWANARTTLAAAATAMAAGDTIWVSNNHAETQTTAMTLAFTGTQANPVIVICVDDTKASPGAGDWLATATVTTTTAANITLTGSVYMYGVTISCGTGGTGTTIILGNTAGHWQKFEQCAFRLLQTGGGTITIGTGGSSQTKTEMYNCSVQFGAIGQSILPKGDLTWTNLATFGNAVTGATLPSAVFGGTASGCTVTLNGLDFSSLTFAHPAVGSINAAQRYYLNNCKQAGSNTGLATAPAGVSYAQTFIAGSDYAAGTYRLSKYVYEGNQTTDTAVVRTGGQTDGATPASIRIVTANNTLWIKPFEGLPIAKWNATTGANLTITMYGVWSGTTLPNNDDIWFEVQYLGTSGTTLLTVANTTKTNFSAANSALAADTSAWDSAAAAWVASHPYNAGDVISGTSVGNAGRIFICITGGTANGTAPTSAFGTAIDGTQVTENVGVTNVPKWQAAYRFSMSITLSSPQPQLAGYLYVIPKAARASWTYWLDGELA